MSRLIRKTFGVASRDLRASVVDAVFAIVNADPPQEQMALLAESVTKIGSLDATEYLSTLSPRTMLTERVVLAIAGL